jgi:hypothetical protein
VSKPNTDYRADGNFFLRRVCTDCGAEYYDHAMQSASCDTRRCGSCEHQVWELEQLFGEQKKEKSS